MQNFQTSPIITGGDKPLSIWGKVKRFVWPSGISLSYKIAVLAVGAIIVLLSIVLVVVGVNRLDPRVPGSTSQDSPQKAEDASGDTNNDNKSDSNAIEKEDEANNKGANGNDVKNLGLRVQTKGVAAVVVAAQEATAQAEGAVEIQHPLANVPPSRPSPALIVPVGNILASHSTTAIRRFPQTMLPMTAACSMVAL